MSLITTIAELKRYVAIDGNMKMATIMPFIEEAEQLYIVDLLGNEFYEEFKDLYESSVAPTDPVVPLSEPNAKLLAYVQRCLAYYTQLLAIPHLSVTFGDMGIRQHRGEDNDAAPRWKEEKLLFNALKNGDIHADKLLQFLEENASPTVYATWYASTSNTKNSGYIVYSTAVASKHIGINNSRRVFLQLRNKVREIETRMIPKLIGQDQYEELVVQIKTGGSGIPTVANKALIEKLEPIISKRALFMQLQFMRVQITEQGIFLYSGTDDIIKPAQLAGDTDIKILRQQLMDGEELGYLADESSLKQFILDNISDYPLIASSGVYTVQPDPGPTWRAPDPGPDDKFMAV